MSFCLSRVASRRGFSLAEAAIVLALVAFITAAIWSATRSVSSARRVNDAVTQMAQITQNMRALFAGSGGIIGNTSNITVANMRKAEIFPPSMLSSDTSVAPVNAFGGAVDIYTLDAVNKNSFYLVMDIPDDPESCIALGMRLVNEGRDKGMIQLMSQNPSGGTTQLSASGGGLDDVKPSQIIANCSRIRVQYDLRGDYNK